MTTTSNTFDPVELRRAFGCFPSGVTAVCALVDGGPVGMAASTFTSVSLDPPLVSVCVARTSTTWPALRRSTRIGVSVLNSEHGAICRQLSARDVDRFAGVDWTALPNGSVVLNDAAAWLDCGVEEEITAGDHVIALLSVQAIQAAPAVAPLVFHGSRFRRLAA
ncbi:flavin reductase family protein [Thermobifida halotolerans]|uniref:Flavin reductase family protein n=1 Tax=Thermobifida halotolerans TaxID=483545 RepID=A0A399G6N0_9ACTN|nr:flavin reductase family protein [Thermobifida halotolerans]UOE17945.1 flavin reductase family protein [Thermobifida halotolerans]